MSEMDEAARRREEVAQLRAAARSTTPEAYRVHSSPKPVAELVEETRQTYSNLLGALTKDRSPRDAIAIACMLGSNGLAYILLILVLNLAQCSWWYEPGMYNGGYEHETRSGR